MLDIKYILANFDEVSARLKSRNPEIDLSLLEELDSRRRSTITEVESLKAEKKNISKEIGKLKSSGEDASHVMARVDDLGIKINVLDSSLGEIETELTARIEVLPNIPLDPTPMVPDKSGNKAVKEWGDPVDPENWNFEFKNHIEVADNLAPGGGLDFPRASKMTGSNWPMYRGSLAHLEWALVKFLIDRAVASARELIIPPYVVNEDSMYASGQFPKFREQAYEVEKDRLVLIPTSEVPLLNLYRDEILPGEFLPFRAASFTPCFRREAGTYGKEERGLIRLHQFHKVEIFSFVSPADSEQELQNMTRYAEELVEALGLTYRTTLLAAGDLAQQSACTYDVEVWLPGQHAFSEVSSISNCTDYQARRANIRYRPKDSKKPEFLHTLNGSALATSRLMVSILEHYQREDGGLNVPEVLVDYMGGQKVIENAKSS